MPEMVTEVSDFHRNLMTWLEQNGISCLEEVSFPPYRVDIWVTDAHAIIEADGYGHTKTKDDRRDAVLEHEYSLLILHVTPEQFAKKSVLAPRIDEFLGTASDDAAIRWERCKRKTPWL